MLRLREGGAEDKGERKGGAKCLSSAGGGEQGQARLAGLGGQEVQGLEQAWRV